MVGREYQSHRRLDPPLAQDTDLSVHRDEEFIGVPDVAGSTLPPLQATGALSSEFHRLLSDCFIRDVHTAFDKHLLDFTIAQTETIIEPHCMANDFGRKSVPNVGGTVSFHRGIVPCGELN